MAGTTTAAALLSSSYVSSRQSRTKTTTELQDATLQGAWKAFQRNLFRSIAEVYDVPANLEAKHLRVFVEKAVYQTSEASIEPPNPGEYHELLNF